MQLTSLAMVLAGCSAPTNSNPGCPFTDALFIGPTNMALVGQRGEHVLGLPVACASPELVDFEATALDTDNDPIPVEARLEGAARDLLVYVTFTPRKAGYHHLTVRFGHNLGVLQGDVLAIATVEVPHDGGLRVAPALASCGHIDVSPGGLTVCLDQPTVVYADTERVQELALGSSPAMAGGVIWTASGERWVEGSQLDGGRGFRRAPDESVPLVGTILLAGATSDRVLALDSDRVLRQVRVVDGGLATEELGAVPQQTMGVSADYYQPLCWSGGDTVLLTDVAPGCRTLESGVTVCAANGHAVASEPGGLWQAFEGHTKSFVRLVRHDRTRELDLPLGMRPRQSRQWNTATVFSYDAGPWSGDYVASNRDGSILIERFDGDVHSATGEWVFLKNPMRAWRRPAQ